ncbi:MAG: D-alanine--D-alanine ligase [Gammaproteobacteria bacterium]|nr:D-alanine--D-alanine ligase [Gammaproteobacteria bacterium]|tara:strand:+ start:7354 stop:8262 length:909 start_codon:yes stop_codon:yes gene_type:complete
MDNLIKKNIGILSGGWSEERQISLESGQAVFDALKNTDFNVFLYDLKNNLNDLTAFITDNSIDIVFNLIHGTGGEDGTVQAWLDNLGVKYIGSDAKSSELSFSKILTKEKWIENDLKTPKYFIVDKNNLNIPDINNIKYVFKPDKSGSSVGIKILNNIKELSRDLPLLVKSSDEKYFIEEYVEGYEYTAPIIDNNVFPIIKIETKREFYNYEAKYIDNDTNFTFPKFNQDMLKEIEKTCLKAFKILGCKGWGRVDFFINNKDEIHLIEVNTIPGMTSHSLVPMSAKKKGLNFIDLIIAIINS